ncbi:transcriptional regulator, LuxR family [Marvinbryantia formatexigens DSM 14469]|uniref:Transcriptional regulator, LuxR family n=1 Tax=Marvinbryantia formatexigens DSM 14469 TaxID=478749 RepID=C6LGQ2_9FIRM|nr:transcriptional regulator, LuxR family [Marvinbryantia formatexigens DSM 14469]
MHLKKVAGGGFCRSYRETDGSGERELSGNGKENLMQRTEKEAKEKNREVYLRPKQAARKLKVALEMGNAVYLYGVTGIGKTALVRDVLARRPYEYYPAAETEPEDIRTEPEKIKTELAKTGRRPEKTAAAEDRAEKTATKEESGTEETEAERIVVIDGLHGVTLQTRQEEYAALIKKLLGQERVRLLLISRAPVPGWLLPLHMEYRFVEIAERDFYFTQKEQEEYLERCGIYLEPDAAGQAWELAKGHPAALRLLVMEKGDIRLAVKNMWLWLENHVFDQWEAELQEFLMETSIVENYTRELAGMLTGRNNVDELISRAEELGNFMTKTGQDGVWEYRWGMRQAMRQRIRKKYNSKEIQRLYSNAGLYYEMHGQIREALDAYETCRDEESVLRVLCANARRNPAAGAYFELREYYLSLPEETVMKNPALISYMSMLHSILMDEEKSEYWYRMLEKYAGEHGGSEKREAKRWLVYLDIALPHRGSAGLIPLLKSAGSMAAGHRTALPELSVTTNLPSLMNGGKDFCEWSKRDKELAASIGKAVSLALGEYGKGLVPLALAESGLEKGADSFEVMRLAEKGRLNAEGRVELCFVASALLAWLAILNGNAEYAEEIMETFRGRAKREAPRMLPNIDAFLCRIFLYQKRPAKTMEWLDTAPKEADTFCTLERFRYLTKARVYLQAGRYEAALGLLEELLYYAEKMKRTYIKMEASLLLAVTLYRLGREEWRETLQSCITCAEGYHFVRLFSRECGAVPDLLEVGGIEWTDEGFQKQVLEECRKMAKLYPGYLCQGTDSEVRLSGQAVRILRMQAEGISIKEIARRLGIREDTVKYHNRETYRKLGVSSRTAAIHEARLRKLI